MSKPTFADKFWAKVNKDGPVPESRPDLGSCWEWTASRSFGYGQFAPRYRGPNMKAHRFAYELLVGAVPDGLELDHLCRNRGCVNPRHLEPVTHRENCLRGTGVSALNAAKTSCVHGHEYDEANTYVDTEGNRHCRECRRISDRRRRPPGTQRSKGASK